MTELQEIMGLKATEDIYALTTVDNPYDPFKDFVKWWMYDKDCGYNTCEYLARIARLSEDFSEQENNKEIENAIDEILRYDFMGIYKKVKRDNKG